jgi:predicted flap endonuclease-1-like 5' DNA nuclease
MQGQLKETRSDLEVAIAQRDRLQGELRNLTAKDEVAEKSIREKNDKIRRLSVELANWQSRVPPLVERYRTRDEEARELEGELEDARADRNQFRDDLEEARTQLHVARARITALESMVSSDQTRIEPVDAGAIPGGLDASNEPHDDTLENEIIGLKDQIDDVPDPSPAWQSDDDADRLSQSGADDDGPWARGPAEDKPGDDIDDASVASLDSLESSAESALPPYFAAPNGGDIHVPGNSSSAQATEQSADDLRQIKGIGPSIEKMLHDLGFFRYYQIAEMTEYDIDRVARQLKGFRSRIYREDWIGQARMLQIQKNSSPS